MNIIPVKDCPGWMTDNDLAFLMDIASEKDVCEIGIWKGRTTVHLLQTCKSLVAIDPWEGLELYPNHGFSNDGNVFAGFAANIAANYTHRGKWFEIYKKPSALVAREMHPNRTFDVVFIDGNHFYDYVVEDIGLWVPRVRIGGWLCGHDYTSAWEPTKLAVNDVVGPCDHYPTIKEHDAVWGVKIGSTDMRADIAARALKVLPELRTRTKWMQHDATTGKGALFTADGVTYFDKRPTDSEGHKSEHEIQPT